MRATELRRALETALEATKDPVFEDALFALEVYGFSIGIERAADRLREDNTIGILRHMKVYVEHGDSAVRLSAQEAAEKIVSEFGVHGQSFAAVVQDYRHRFGDWAREGFGEVTPPSNGDLGYRVHVTPAPGTVVPLPEGGRLNQAGAEQAATSFWRRRFREGSVSLRRVAKS